MIAQRGMAVSYSTHQDNGRWYWALNEAESSPSTWDWHGPYPTQNEAKAAAKAAIDKIINQLKAQAEASLKEMFGGK